MSLRFLCGWGWHSWRFIEMGNRRVVNVPGHSMVVCTIKWRCRRCGLKFTQEDADMPKRVRT